MNKRVCIKADHILEEIGDEITVYHPRLTTALYLNDSGALIWRLCDGHRRIADIITILEDAYPQSADQIRDDVLMLIRRLVEHEVVDLCD